MTVKSLADQLRTTRATLYRHIDALGIDLADLRTEDGQIKPDHLPAIIASFDSVTGEQLPDTDTVDTVQQCAGGAATDTDSVQVLVAELNEAKLEIERLRTQLDEREQAYRTQVDTLNKTVDMLSGQVEAWHSEAVKVGERYDRMLSSGQNNAAVAASSPLDGSGGAAADPEREQAHNGIGSFFKRLFKQ